MSLWNSIKSIFDINVSTSSTINLPDMLIAGFLFVIVMYVANMFFPGDRTKLISIALLALVLLYAFFFL